MMNVIQSITDFQNELTEWRRDIHAHPELGFEEERTAKLVAKKLQCFGLDVQRGLGKTGVIGTLRVGNSKRAIGLRADIDALPIIEANQFEHRSKYPGKMHACGHDGHTVMLLAAARYLSESKNFNGCVHFIFQPAEEGLGGAEAMLLDGLFEQFPMEAVFGMHNSPGMPVGKFAILKGPMMAGGAFFDIHLVGKGAHGARPEASIDPVITAAHITTALQTIVSRNVAPTQPLVISVTQIHSGDAYNVIPQTAVLSGTVRAFSKNVLAMAEERIGQLATSIAAGFGTTAELDYRVRFLTLVNQAEETDFAVETAAELVGWENIHRDFPLIMASEDFSYMLDACPGAYINIGNGDQEGFRGVHNPAYEFNDAILTLGASYYARLVERRLVKENPQDG